MYSIRWWVAALAAASMVAPGLVLGLVAFPMLIRTSEPISPTILFVSLAAWAAVVIARIILSPRLSLTEQALVRFWSFAPLLVFLLCLASGALSLLLLYALGVRLPLETLQALLALLLAFSAFVVRGLWLRFRASLLADPNKGAA
jgi:hypothetical protein